ncbi:MAG: hypothetical protein JRI78_12655 [Deltaproteobacteria bacterium]|nr:hypothetical protein [Deltaproteobacteria bacterium]
MNVISNWQIGYGDDDFRASRIRPHPDDGWCKVPLTSLPADENGYSICTSKDASKSASADKAVDCGPWIQIPDEILLYN